MNEISYIDPQLIDPHPDNPRRDLGDLDELVASIKAQGIQQNLLVVRKEGGRYTAVIGHRRLAAALMAGVTEVPAVISDTLTDAEQIELMLLENVQRTNLSPVEEAEGYQDLLDLGLKVRDIAGRTGRAEKTVTARLRLTKLPASAREKVHLQQATLEDAADLASFADHPKLMAKLADGLGTHNWRWMLEDARRARRKEEVLKPIIKELKKAGIPHHPSDSYSWSEYRRIGNIDNLKDLEKAIADGIPEGASWVNSYSGIVLIRPITDEERSADNQESDEDAAKRAEREAIEAEADTAMGLRDEFIRDLMRKKLSTDQATIITSNLLPRVLVTGSHLWDLESFAGVQNPTTPNVADALRAAFPDANPVCWLLIGLHRHVPKYGWDTLYTSTGAVLLYSVLEQLGYQLSDVERARLTPPAEDASDVEGGDGDE